MAKKQNLKLYDPYTEMITRFHANDSLSIKMRQLVQLLSKKTSVPIKYFGLDASMLAAMDQKKSDIDLVVYGKKNAWLVRKAYENLIEDNNSKITSPLKMAKTIIKRRRSYSPLMTCKEILEWEMSKISGYFMKTKFSVMPININGKYKTKYIPTNQFGAIRVKLKDSEIVCDPGITDLSRHEVSIIYGPDNITINQYITFLPSRMGIFLKKGDTLFIIGKIYKTTSNNSTFALTQFPWDDSDSTGRSYFVTKKEMTNLQHLIPSLFGLNLNSNCYTDK